SRRDERLVSSHCNIFVCFFVGFGAGLIGALKSGTSWAQRSSRYFSTWLLGRLVRGLLIRYCPSRGKQQAHRSVGQASADNLLTRNNRT
ncbi:unnamed protein product, partial [Ectocarpus sp. 4 AP-2014]